MASAGTVLITGAAGALGSSVVKRFLAGGYQVLGTYIRTAPPPVQGVQWFPMDVTSSQSVRSSIRSILALPAQIGKIDALVHCAGGFRYANTESLLDQDLEFLMDVNLRSAFFILREILPIMKKNAFGRIVLVSSKATLNAPAGMGAYAASKAGLNALVSSIADEVRSFDININAVLPSILDTAANRKDMPQADFSTWVTADALSEIIFSLTQPWGKPVHGALIPVSGRI